ncbi:MAG: motility associated factor glycosyltransferase family protein [Deltaproteobacteria bacterium]|nr:motility associated factor glycosyltransferase family protein [Deltaproteobacteria bacterium]
MNILERNCKALSLKNKELAERLLAFSTVPVHLEETRSGDWTFKIDDKYFHSRYDPIKEAKVQAEEILSRKSDWVILFGLGCGYILRALACGKKDSAIVYEPSIEILRGVLEKIDLSDILSREKVYLFDSIASAIDIIRCGIDPMENLLCYSPAPYKVAFAQQLQDFNNRVNNAHMTNKVGLKTDIDSRLKWIENYFENLNYFPQYSPVDTLKDKFKGKPMIIAGAGPSLKKNAHLLKDLKGKAVIVAAITAYKPLLKYGVVPDFIIASEKVDLPEYFTYGEEDKNTRLILAEISHPGMFTREVKDKFIFFNPYINLSLEHGKHWGSNYFPAIGGSVTTAALDMGVMFGCSPIVFIGQDLCFGENETHAPGGVYIAQNVRIDKEKGEVIIEEDYVTLKDKARSRFNLQWLKGLNGGLVPSKFDWATFHQWFENYMVFLKKTGLPISVINATEGGAYIEGMEHITLKEAIARDFRGEFNIDEIMEEAVKSRQPVDYRALYDSFSRMLVSLKGIDKTAIRILKEVKEAKREFNKNGNTPILVKSVGRIGRMVESLLEEAQGASFLWETLIATTSELKEFHREEQACDSTERFGRELGSIEASYTRMDEMCRRFIPILDNILSMLDSHLEKTCSSVEKKFDIAWTPAIQ